MTEFPSQQASGVNAYGADEETIAREALSTAMLLCIEVGDTKAFERNFVQLKPFLSSVGCVGGPVLWPLAFQSVVPLALTAFSWRPV